MTPPIFSKSHVIILLAVMLSVSLLMHGNIEKAFAISFQYIVTTGLQTDDNCTAITEDLNGNVWQYCDATYGGTNNNIYVYNDEGVFIDDIAVINSESNAGSPQLMPLLGLTVGIIYKSASQFDKYTLSGSTIIYAGSFDPPSCSVSNRASYDKNGWIWFGCTDTDKIGAFNPTSLTAGGISADLTNAVGSDCDAPESVGADYVTSTTGYVFAGCDTSDLLESFSFTLSSNTFTIATEPTDTEAHNFNGESYAVHVDDVHTRIITTAGVGSGLNSFTHASGVISAEYTNVGSAQTHICENDFYVGFSQGKLFCVGSTGIEGFLSNATGFYNLFNQASYTTGSDSRVGTYIGDTYYVATGGTNDGVQDFIKITGLTDLDLFPDDIGGDDDDETPAICNPPFQDVDSDGDCDNPAFTGGGGRNVTDIGEDVACNFGIIPCASGEPINPDIQTNGIGHGLYLILLLTFLALAGLAVKGKKTDDLHLVLYAVAIIGTASFAFVVGWIDATILVISMISLIALGATKATSLVAGKFGGDD